jgi:hypothetical protein
MYKHLTVRIVLLVSIATLKEEKPQMDNVILAISVHLDQLLKIMKQISALLVKHVQ